PIRRKSEQLKLLHQIVFDGEIQPVPAARCTVTDFVSSVEIFQTQAEGRTPLVNIASAMTTLPNTIQHEYVFIVLTAYRFCLADGMLNSRSQRQLPYCWIRFDCFLTICRIFCSEQQRRMLSRVHTSRYPLNLQAATPWAARGRHNRQSYRSRRRSRMTTRHQADISATRRPVPKLQSRLRGSR